MWRYNHASPLSICFFQRVQVQLVFLMFLSPVCLCVPTKHTPNCYSILFTVLNIRFICQYSKSASDTNRKLVYVDPVYNEDIYIYVRTCIYVYVYMIWTPHYYDHIEINILHLPILRKQQVSPVSVQVYLSWMWQQALPMWISLIRWSKMRGVSGGKIVLLNRG